MALDLFANFERHSNSSLFYRVTSASPYTFTLKLSDLNLPNQDLRAIYDVEVSHNKQNFVPFPYNQAGEFIANLTYNTTSPCVCSIDVKVAIGETLIQSFALSGVFVDRFPVADFIAFPLTYIDESANKIVSLKKANYNQSPGLYFYGEGHTETIFLSARGTTDNPKWFVGTVDTGFLSIIPVSPFSSYTAHVDVPSTPNETSSYPISLWVTTSQITTAGPVVTYSDVTGNRSYYPFFTSTIDVNGVEHRQQLKGNIQVLPYPSFKLPILNSPFSSSYFNLPINYDPQTFTAYISNPSLTGIVTETLVHTQWELQSIHDSGILIQERVHTTPPLSSIVAYRFQLAYDQPPEELVLPYYVSPNFPTTVVLNVSSVTNLKIDLPPYDWAPRQITLVNTASAIIGPITTIKLYVSNFYNLTGEYIPITLVDAPDAPIEIESLIVRSSFSDEDVILSGYPLAGTMRFDSIGVVNLVATASLRNTITDEVYEITTVIPNMLEIVSSYDDLPNENYSQSSLTPLSLSYNSLPRLSPNDWAIADNINSVITKLHTIVGEMDSYTKVYEQKGSLYGWIGTKLSQHANVWQDVECPGSYIDNTTWSQYESETSALSARWAYHECVTENDPACLQKHCLEWKWSSRKLGNSTVNVTWKTAKLFSEYAKKWTYERCEYDSVSLNCPRDSWKILTIDPVSFPIPSYKFISRCKIVDVEISSPTNQMVIAYDTQIELVNTDYVGTRIARIGTADDVFAFQNITGMTINSEGKIIVIDSVLCKITVFNIIDNTFVRITSWGNYGLAGHPTGFSRPQDVHVDSDDQLWIADTGNNCIKRLTINGKPLMTITHSALEASAPISVCVDADSKVHCLTNAGVVVFDQSGTYLFEYSFPSIVTDVVKINTSYNREMIYITHLNGVARFFKNGKICLYTIQNLECADGTILQGYNSVSQDKFRNLYATVGDKILKVLDLQKIVEQKATIPADLYWPLNELLVHKEEYIQPWVYLKSFHRLWDNIELLRNSLFYDLSGCKSYTKPTYSKTDLILGQNEIVTNAAINRLSEQLWTNIQSLIKYFDPNC